jgi:hypothetical protein
MMTAISIYFWAIEGIGIRKKGKLHTLERTAKKAIGLEET